MAVGDANSDSVNLPAKSSADSARSRAPSARLRIWFASHLRWILCITPQH